MKKKWFIFLLLSILLVVVPGLALPEPLQGQKDNRTQSKPADTKPADTKPADTQPSSEKKIQHLLTLCKLWGKVHFFHPYLNYKNIDWDAALVNILPDIYAAETDRQFNDAVKKLLAVLEDPVTFVAKKRTSVEDPEIREHSLFQLTDDKVLVIDFTDYNQFFDFYGLRTKMRTVIEKIPESKGVIIDLRCRERLEDYYYLDFYLADFNLLNALFSGTIMGSGSRSLQYYGFAPQSGVTSGDYQSFFRHAQGNRHTGVLKGDPKPVVFLFNKDSEIPTIATSMQAAEKALLLCEDKLNYIDLSLSAPIELPDNQAAQIRVSESILSDGTGDITPDLVFPAEKTVSRQSPAFQEALKLAGNMALFKKAFKARPAGTPLPVVTARPEAKQYYDMTYPSRAYRILALYKIWNTFHYFFPYKDLLERDWEDVAREFIPRFESAADETEYVLAVCEMLTHLHDSHIGAYGNSFWEYMGRAVPPISIRMIEDRPVVTRVFPEHLKDIDIKVGDVILKVDGEDVKTRIERYGKYFTASTPQAHMNKIMSYMLNGKDDSLLTLVMEDESGKEKEVRLPRKAAYRNAMLYHREGEIFKLISKDIGYADLNRLTPKEVDRMFDTFKDTKAVILDMRGYPQGTAWSIAPRLTEKKDVVGATFRGVIVDASRSDYTYANYFFKQKIPNTDKWRYKGKTVMLIDERAVSQAEHSGLFFEAANNTTFIGSPTNGANGDVTNFYVPGGILITFTGQAVFHADGRQLQRIGLQPHIPVKPTIAGIRAGKDEVMEKAIQYLEKEIKEIARK